jgi:hypothetical protein
MFVDPTIYDLKGVEVFSILGANEEERRLLAEQGINLDAGIETKHVPAQHRMKLIEMGAMAITMQQKAAMLFRYQKTGNLGAPSEATKWLRLNAKNY